MDNNAFVSDLIAADATFEATTNDNFTAQIQTLGSNMAASDASILSTWEASYATVITTCVATITTLVTNYYTNVIVPAKDANVAFYATQIRARNAQLVQQFALIRPPEDVARITAKLEAIAVLSIAAYDSQQTAIINTKRDAVLAKAGDATKQNNLMQSFISQFSEDSNNAVAAFLADLTLRDQIFHDVLAIADAQFATDLLNTLNTSDPPLTLDQANALVTTRNQDRDQIIVWRQQLLVATYTQANTARIAQDNASITRFNNFDITTFSMGGRTTADYYNE